jgi:predicted membrane protein
MAIGRTETGGSLLTPRLIVGLAIALFGVVLVFDRLNVGLASQVLRFWPAVIVAVGLLVFVQSRKIGGGVNGLVLMGIGAWLLLNSLGIVQVRFWELFWPIILIVIGTALVMQTLGRPAAGSPEVADDTVSIFAVLSGVKRTSGAARFRGGEVTVFMGGGHIDLRQATIPRGQEAVINIVAVMGGCEIAVPSSWTIATPLVPVMGGVEDKRLPALPEGLESSAGGLAPPRLVLSGFVMMGGVVIKG